MLTGFHVNHKKKWRDWGGRSLLGPPMFCCIHRTATAYCCAAAACTLVTHAAVRVCLGLSAINPIPLAAATGLVLQGGKRADAHMPCSSSRSRLPQLAAATPSSSRMVLWHLVWNSAMHTCLPPDQASHPAKHWNNLPATSKHIPARRLLDIPD